MDITSINFNETKYGTTFDKLDVNSDGVINDDDLLATDDADLAETIQQVLDDADEESDVTDVTTDATDSVSSTDSTASTASTESTASASSTSSTASTIATLQAEKTANLEQIEQLNDELAENGLIIEQLDVQINALTSQVEDDIKQANEEIAKLIEEKEAAFQQAVNDAVEEAKNQEVEEGEEPKSFADILAGKMTSDLEISGNLAEKAVAAVNSSAKVAMIETLIGEMTTLNTRNVAINAEVQTLTDRNTAIDSEIEALEKTATTATTASTTKCCDPIGFTQDNVEYDFFIDKDNNGDLTNENEFLGAENQWAEMTALDTDNDGKVTKTELEAGNVQVVKSEGDEQSVVNVADVLGDSDYIDLNSYSAAEDGTKYNDNDKQNLLGNFNININGTDVQGYNTLDDVDWLKENFDFTDYASATTTVTDFTNTDTVAKNIANYTQNVENLKKEIDDTWTNLGVTETTYNAFTDMAEEAGKRQGEDAIEDIKAEIKAKAEAEKTETAEAEEEETTTETEENEEKKIVEE